ncbi:MAG: MarR family winged helix-turn-helix transcriptional regulator [Bacteroidota bacterium]
MRLEEEIKQTQPISEYEKGVINIMLTDHFLSSRLKEFLARFGLTTQQYNILRILRGQYPKPSSNNLIKDRMLFKNADTSRLVNRLAEKGYVERTPSEEDRRRVEIRISQQGLDNLEQIDNQIDTIESLLDNLSLEEVTELNRLLDKVRE